MDIIAAALGRTVEAFKPASALPAYALTWNYVKVLSSHCLVLLECGPALHCGAERATNISGPCLTLGLLRLRLQRSWLTTRETVTGSAEKV